MNNKFVVICGLFIVFAGIVRAQTPETVEKVVAVVDGEPIMQSELDALVQSIVAGQGAKFATEEGKKQLAELKQNILQGMIDRKLIVQKAKKKNISVSKGEIGMKLKEIKSRFPSETDFEAALKKTGVDIENYKLRIEEELLANRLVSQEIQSKIEIPANKVMEYYEKNKGKFTRPEELHLRHILVKEAAEPTETKKKIDGILERLKKGADFSAVAKEVSDDAGTKEKGGDLGLVKKGETLKEIEDAAAKLKTGEVSEPVHASAGWHIIKLEEKIPGVQLGLVDQIEVQGEKVKIEDYIRYGLKMEEGQKKYEEWIKKLRDKAVIELR